MALINPQTPPVNGASPSFAAATASDTFVPVDRGVLIYRTAGTASTLTVVVPGNTQYAQAQPDVAVSMAATDLKAIPTTGYQAAADATTGLVTITASSVTALTVAYIVV